jgi:tetratricopeptide (TPR) repeat protein
VSPNDVTLLRSASGIAQALGDWNASLAKLQAARRLDPRSSRSISALQLAFLWLRRYPEALAASDSTLALAPGDRSFVQDRAMIFAAQGDLPGVRAAMKLVSPAVKPMEVVTFFALYWDMYWALDEAEQQLLMTSRPDDYPDRESWAMVLTQLYALRGDTARMRAFADTALMANAEILKGAPDDGQRLVFRGLQLAYLGRRAESIAAIERGMTLYPIERDRSNGPYYQQLAARAHLLLGDQERALDLLEPVLKLPFFLSPGWLRIDPEFAALRGNPRFERLIR